MDIEGFFAGFTGALLTVIFLLGWVVWLRTKTLNNVRSKVQILKILYQMQHDFNKYKYRVPKSNLKEPPQEVMGVAAEDFNWLITIVKDIESKYSGVWLEQAMPAFFTHLRLEYLDRYSEDLPSVFEFYLTIDKPYEWARWFHHIVRDILYYNPTVITIWEDRTLSFHSAFSVSNKFKIEVWHSDDLDKEKIMEALNPKPDDYYDR